MQTTANYKLTLDHFIILWPHLFTDRLPSELSWENIKYALQTNYNRAIPQIGLYQFLMGKNEFLYLDSGVKGMSLLSEEWTKILLSGLNGVLANFKQVVSEHLASYKLKDFAWEQTTLALLVILDT